MKKTRQQGVFREIERKQGKNNADKIKRGEFLGGEVVSNVWVKVLQLEKAFGSG